MIESYKDLVIWQRSTDLVVTIYRIADNLPSKEQFGLILQMKRAVVSIPSNITEGYGRRTSGNYISFSLLPEVPFWNWKRRLSYVTD